MNKLNVFNTFYSPWRYPSNWIRNMRTFFRQFKWAYQRITRGYCDFDYWDLDSYLSRLMADSIEALANNGHGYPGTKEFPTYESWQKYLLDITAKLRFSLSELPNEYEDAWRGTFDKDTFKTVKELTPEEKEIRNNYLEKENQNEKLKLQAQDEALDMIKHVYNSLWD